MKPLPFKLDRERRTSSLVEQVVDGFRQAIVGGAYRVGDRIPSLRNLAKELGVSLRVPREAIAILSPCAVVAPNGLNRVVG